MVKRNEIAWLGETAVYIKDGKIDGYSLAQALMNFASGMMDSWDEAKLTEFATWIQNSSACVVEDMPTAQIGAVTLAEVQP